MPYTEMENITLTKLALISQRARKDPEFQFTSLAHLLNEGFLKECYYKLSRDRASGIDGVSWKVYGDNLDENISNLVSRLKAKRYKLLPTKGVYISKNEHEERPLGLPALEDKTVQKGISRILEAIYEADFLGCSYGFRPKRTCHQALNVVDKIVMRKYINYVIEADIKSYFDKVSHEWMMKFLQVRIKDSNFLLLIGRFLKAGYFEAGKVIPTDQGNPQGGNLSPILSNIFLHYVLDLWFDKKVIPRVKGHYQYYGVSGNIHSLTQFYSLVERMILKWLNRRSQGRSFNWERFRRYRADYPLPKPRIVHNFYTLSPVE